MTHQLATWLGNVRGFGIWVEPLLSFLLLSSLLLVLAYAGTLAVQRSSAARRIWRAAFVALPLLLLAEVTGLTNLVFSSLSLAATALWSAADSSATIYPGIASRATPSFSFLLTIREEVTWLMTRLAFVWLTITLVLLARLAWFRLTLSRRSAELLPVESPQLVSRLRRLTARQRLRQPVRLAILPGLCSPLVFGARRPTLALPEDFEDQFAPDAQDAILAHELAHVASADYAWQFFAEFITALLWWHPLIWWARRRLLAVNELAADEATLHVHDGPSLLAEALVITGRQLLGRRVQGAFAIIGTRRGLGQRVRNLLHLADEPGALRPTWKRCFLGGTLATMVILAGTSFLSAKTHDLTLTSGWQETFRTSLLGRMLHDKPTTRFANYPPGTFVCPLTGQMWTVGEK
jgi:beta-lactamase regulating signal transducer with metallopeptidase domain